MDVGSDRPPSTDEPSAVITSQVLAQWLSRVACGDKSAFERLYRLAGPRLFVVIRRMIPHRAEDVLQETFLTIWRKSGLFDPTVGDPLAWMTTIARHHAIDWLRRTGGKPPGPLPDFVSGAATTDDHSIFIAQCLEKLPPAQRKAILLAYYYGMTHEEISRSIGIPLGTVKSRVRRGLVTLKDLIDR